MYFIEYKMSSFKIFGMWVYLCKISVVLYFHPFGIYKKYTRKIPIRENTYKKN